jgi:hypothetical protein
LASYERVLNLRPDDKLAERNQAVVMKKLEAKRAMQTLQAD